MFETIAVVVVFFMLLSIGFIFYEKMQRGNAAQQLREDQNRHAQKIARTTLNMPELQCTATSYCFDKKKIEAFEQYYPGVKIAYYELLGKSRITIDNIEIYDQSPTGSTSKEEVWLPVALYDPVSDESKFAILTVDLYE